MATSIFPIGGGDVPEMMFAGFKPPNSSFKHYFITYNFKTGERTTGESFPNNYNYYYDNDFVRVYSAYDSDNDQLTIKAAGIYSIYILKTEVVKKQAVASGTTYKTIDYRYDSKGTETNGSFVVLKW